MPKQSNKTKGQEVGRAAETEEAKWLSVAYQPVSLFSLKRSDATSMAARSNLVPTPYAIKMALLRVMLEEQGRHHSKDFDRWIQSEFAWIRGLQIFVLPPEKLIVNRNGYKLRYYDQTADKADKSRSTLPMQDGFVFREWVHLEGNLKICAGATDRLLQLEQLFAQIYYFGKRGCFFQYLPDQVQKTKAAQFIPDVSSGFTVQPMDDLGPQTTFNRINPFSTDKAQLDRDRIVQPGLLPLRLTATGARYDFYERS